MAEQVLQYSLARCADGAVLLTDRALGGADTVATANPLAFAVRKIARKLLNNKETYYIVCGMQSVDGDTAQVPAQLSEELGIPCVAYVTDVRLTKQRFEFTRIIQGGTQTVAPSRLPAVVTVANYTCPLFASFARTRKALQTKVIQWGAQDIGASLIGVKGSKTAVIRVFPPGKSHRRCERIHDPRDLAEIITKTLQDDDTNTPADDADRAKHYLLPQRREHIFDRRFEGTQREQEDYQYLSDIMAHLGICQLSDINKETKERLVQAVQDRFHKRTLEDMLQGYGLTKPAYAGDVWVIAEQNNGIVHPATFELIGQARELADSLEVKVGVCLAGYQIKSLTPGLIAAGADCVYTLDYKVLEHFDPGIYRLAVARTIKAYWPQIVLFAATPQGRVLAPMVSYRLKCGLTADCTGFDIRDSSRKGDIGILLQTRPALGGNVMATIRTKQSRCQMATARPGVMQRLPEDPQRTGEVVSQRVQLRKTDGYLEIIHSEFSPMDIDLGGAEVIVSGGRGMQSQEGYQALIGSFCETLQARLDKRVEKGASRAAVEQGFTTRAYQVGQTGTAVGPTLYVALGISGAIQHMIGISKSQTIIAINSDPEAPIFRQCDYYMIGQVEECVPRLLEVLTNQQGDPS
jgi:electron transfer flavoprotein alpha subunit